MHRLIDLSLRNKFLVLILTAVFIAVGVYSMERLPVDAVPDVTPNQLLVLTQAPGHGPVEVERFITFPVETAMSGLPGITDIRSVSRFGLSSVYIYFEEGMDIYFARRLVMERLPEAREAIPEGFGTPSMGPISTGLGEIYQFEVKGDGKSLMELRSILEWDIAFRLRSVPGVVEVNSYGGELKTYEVQLDPDKLVAYNVTLDQVFEALERNNANAGGAYIERAQEQYVIRGAAGEFIARVDHAYPGVRMGFEAHSRAFHTGTHMDGPRHFFSGAPGLDTMPLDAVIGPARVIEIQDRRSITVEELRRHRIRRGERVLFKTYGAAARWRKRSFDGGFVYISEGAAQYLAARGVRTVGIDYLSVGGFKKDSAETHRALLGGGVWIIEWLDLTQIAPGRYDMVALPVGFLNSDGAPARVALRARD
jgi:multidrug efflux pump subunit AcrB